jgi:hypothetical protein
VGKLGRLAEGPTSQAEESEDTEGEVSMVYQRGKGFGGIAFGSAGVSCTNRQDHKQDSREGCRAAAKAGV